MNPPVGKSGPGIYLSNSAVVIFGSSIKAIVALIASDKLCVGISVEIPTAIPVVPFTSKFGNLHGRVVGSSLLSSKFGTQSTVSLSMSLNTS